MTPEATYKLVERILDENSAWIARPSPRVTQLIADAITEAVQAQKEADAAIAELFERRAESSQIRATAALIAARIRGTAHD
jgi:hypothetical protein